MKTKIFKPTLLGTMVLLSLTTQAQRLQISQDPKYGSDSISRIQCASNLSIVNQYVKIKTYEYAYDAWSYCFHSCPESSKNIYIHGAKILKYYIENAKDDESAQKYVDTLMLLYDQRMQYFNQPGYVYGVKGVDLLRYRKSAVEEAYGYLQKSIDIREDKIDESVAVTFMSTSYLLFQDKKIEADIMVNNYLKVIDLLQAKLQSGQDIEDTPTAIESVEKIFAESGAADCASLVSIFTPRYEANPNDADLLKKITSLLDRTGCLKEDLYAKSAESLYKVEPSAESASKLAKLFYSREEYDKAKQYFSLAIEQETDADKKAEYYYNLAYVNFIQKDYPETRKNCQQAILLRSNYGDAYLLIGNAYAQCSPTCGTNEFEKAAVYWAAVDQFAKAKSVDPSVSEKANDYIVSYSQRFPNNETAFFNGYTDGQMYKVGCWINESTKVRTTK